MWHVAEVRPPLRVGTSTCQDASTHRASSADCLRGSVLRASSAGPQRAAGRPYDDEVPLSRRSAPDARPNSLALARERLAGVELADLSDSNPTRHGLTDPATAEIVARAAARPPAYDPEPRGPLVAREALAERFGGSPSDYWLTAGTSEAYGWLFTLLTDPGDAVAIPQPGYPLVEPLARLTDVEVVGYPAYYLHPHGWEYDLGALAQCLSSRAGRTDDERLPVPAHRAVSADERRSASPSKPTLSSGGSHVRAVVAVHPNNPTGAYADHGLLATCAAAGVPVIADEVFWPFTVDAEEPAPRLSGATDTLTFGLDGLSKMIAAPHLKLGWIRLSGPHDQVARVAPVLDRIADVYLPVSTPIANALPDLLALADSTITRVRARLATNMATVRQLLGEPPYRVRRADAGWMALIDTPPTTVDDLAVTLTTQAHLVVQPGWLYDVDSPRVLAVSLLPRPDVFSEGCRRLHDAIDALALS